MVVVLNRPGPTATESRAAPCRGGPLAALLPLCLLTGCGVLLRRTFNDPEELRLLEACEDGRVVGCDEVADRLLRRSEEQRSSPERARALRERAGRISIYACERGSAPACMRAARWHLTQGELVEKKAEARKLLDRACDLGHGPACLEAIRLTKDDIEAASREERACQLRARGGCEALARRGWRQIAGVRQLERAPGRDLRSYDEHLAFSTDGQMLVASNAGTVHRWDSETGQLARTSTQESPGKVTWSLRQIVRRGRQDVLVALRNGPAGVDLLVDEIPVRLSHPLLDRLRSPESGPPPAALSMEAGLLAIGAIYGEDGRSEILLWSVPRGALVGSATFSRGHPRHLALSPDGKTLAVAWIWGVSLIDLPGMRERRFLMRQASICSMTLVEGGARLAVVEQGRALWLLDLHTEAPPRRVALPGAMRAVADPIGRRLAVGTGGRAGALHLLDAASGEALQPPIRLEGVDALRFDRSGRRLALGSSARLYLIELADGLGVGPGPPPWFAGPPSREERPQQEPPASAESAGPGTTLVGRVLERGVGPVLDAQVMAKPEYPDHGPNVSTRPGPAGRLRLGPMRYERVELEISGGFGFEPRVTSRALSPRATTDAGLIVVRRERPSREGGPTWGPSLRPSFGALLGGGDAAFSLDVLGGAGMLFVYDRGKLSALVGRTLYLHPEAGYTLRQPSGQAAAHLGNLGVGVGFGVPWLGLVAAPRLLIGTEAGELAVGLRAGLAIQALFQTLHVSAAYQVLWAGGVPRGEWLLSGGFDAISVGYLLFPRK